MAGMDVILVVAAAENGVIGQGGQLPWHLPDDLRRFKRLTMGRAMLMGRKTFDSIGRPLPGRQNIVLTRQPGWRAEGVTVTRDLTEAVAAAGVAEALMVIGGGEIYRLAMPIATQIELTRVHASPIGDAWFHGPDPAAWREVAREECGSHSYLTFERLELPAASR